MSKNEITNPLTEEYLAELYNAAFEDDYLCGIVCQHMRDEYLPDRQYQSLNDALRRHYEEYHSAPKYAVVRQMLGSSRSSLELLDEIREMAMGADHKALRKQFENYLKLASFKRLYKEVGKVYDSGDGLGAVEAFQTKARELESFTLDPDEFVDVAATLENRVRENRAKRAGEKDARPVTRFYIDALDEKNQGRSLRTQLSVFLAMSGVGKSHLARYIGMCAAYEDGLNVLHIQLEGSESETLDAYSAALVHTRTYLVERGEISEHAVETFRKAMEDYAGTLKVKTYPRFGKEVSTVDVRNAIEAYRKKYGYTPDVTIIDSLDLLNDASGRMWDAKSLRHKRISVAQDLKDLAADADTWMVATYQATIENAEWVNDEKNVLNGFNLSEAKGLQRPCTHLISLNQSKREEAEGTMRIYVAKSRFFPKGQPFRICTNYDGETFYDRERTINLPQDQQ